MVERYPWTAEIPLDALAQTPFPKLVVSGGHSEAFDAVCDVLEERLGAERAVLPGNGHAVQLLDRRSGTERLDAARHYPDQDEVDEVRIAFRSPRSIRRNRTGRRPSTAGYPPASIV